MSCGPHPPVRSGRRIAPIASSNERGRDRPNARDLLGSVNSASSGASASWIAFIGAMGYLAVTLGGITHVDLLLNNPTTLPFVNVKVPLDTFFFTAPLAFVLVHFGLLLQHVILSRKLRAFEERLHKEKPSRNRVDQHIRDELHSYSFTQAVSGKPKGMAVDLALRLITSLTMVILPLLLLAFFQISFLPYHSASITWWHRLMLLADVAVIGILARHLARRDRESKVRLTNWWNGGSELRARLVVGWRRRLGKAWWAISRLSLPIRERECGPVVTKIVRPVLRGIDLGGTLAMRACSLNKSIIALLMLFSLCVATQPDGRLDKAMASIPFLSEPVPYGRPKKETRPDGRERSISCPSQDIGIRCAFHLTAFLFERDVDQTTGKADGWLGWSRNLIVSDRDLVGDDKKGTTLSLRGRDLRYAVLSRSDLKRADLYGADLGSARLYGTNLVGANLHRARLQRANLTFAELQGADLSRADLSGAQLYFANLEGAVLTRAKLEGANLHLARLSGALLQEARLEGADLKNARLEGVDLSYAKLQGAKLPFAKLEGANLLRAGLAGADLTGAHLDFARLMSADVPGGWITDVRGTVLSNARLWGADFTGSDLSGADIRGARIWNTGAPGEWRLALSSGLNIEPLDEKDRVVLGKTVADLKVRYEKKMQENTHGTDRVANALKMVASSSNELLEAKADKWEVSDDLTTWCKVARKPSPSSERLSTYLGKLACEDETDESYLARGLIDRILLEWRSRRRGEPDAFLAAFSSCKAFGRVPADIKLVLQRAGREDIERRERVEFTKKSAGLACNDTTEGVYIARWHLARSWIRHRGTFYEAFRQCPAFARFPGVLRSLLVLAASRQRRENRPEYRTPNVCIDR